MDKTYSFYDFLKIKAARYTDNVAVLYDTHAVAYNKLFEDSKKKAMHLSKFPGENIALYGPASYRWIVNMFGIILAGKNAVLVDFFLPPEMKAKVLAKVGIDYILSSTNQYILANADASIIPEAEAEDTDGMEYDENIKDGHVIMFTATSDECDKPVMLSTKQLLQAVYMVNQYCKCTEEDSILTQISIHHTFGFIYGLLWPLACGACVCIGRGIRHIDADTYYYKVTMITATPAMADYLKRVKAFNSELRCIIIGGAPCSQHLHRYLTQCGLQVFVTYGITECTGCVGINVDNDGSYILYDKENISIDSDGQIVASGFCVMQGYVNDLAATERIKRDGKLYTGDYGYINDKGNLVVTQRNKGTLLLANGEKLCRAMIMRELVNIHGIADSYVMVYDNMLIAVVYPVDKTRTADSFSKIIDRYNDRKGYRWEIEKVVVTTQPLPLLPDGSINEKEIAELIDDAE